MLISDWSSDVCSSDLTPSTISLTTAFIRASSAIFRSSQEIRFYSQEPIFYTRDIFSNSFSGLWPYRNRIAFWSDINAPWADNRARVNVPSSCRSKSSQVERSEEHTSELQSLMRISYAVFCLKKKKINKTNIYTDYEINQQISCNS